MKKFPPFVTSGANAVAGSHDPSVAGFVFDGADDVQIIFWQCEKGGESADHVHDFWEWAVVLEGTFDGLVGGNPLHLGPGEECLIPPGVRHSGRYSAGYRAIDAFSGHRIDRAVLGAASSRRPARRKPGAR